MQKLCDRLKVNSLIKKAYGDNINDVIKKVFSNECYKFYLNSELIDVNDRFRVFEYNNKKYIVNKTTTEDGKLEIYFAYKAMERLNDLIVDNYEIVDKEKFAISFTITETLVISFSIQPKNNESGTIFIENIGSLFFIQVEQKSVSNLTT